jgi:hypothetical protein
VEPHEADVTFCAGELVAGDAEANSWLVLGEPRAEETVG